MSCNVTPMPGTRCVHFTQGRCLLEERRNPGLHVRWQCAVIAQWESAYDSFLNQAEAFQLEIGLATRIWASRLGGMLQQPSPCEAYEPCAQEPGEEPEDDDVLACAHAWAGLCLLRMPCCEGICRHFEHRQPEDGATRG